MSVSDTEIKRWALDASTWLWGTVQGAWNEKMSTSQIIVDAIVGMVPLVGAATAARDLLAVSTRLIRSRSRREEIAEWVLLVILVFALIPLLGGVLKGIGLLLLKAGKTAAENHALLAEIMAFLNRLGHGNQLKFFKELDLLKYQRELTTRFGAFMDKVIEALTTIQTGMGALLSEEMRAAIPVWIDGFKQIKALGASMIPKALKELNGKLNAVQQATYRGELHLVYPGQKNVTREAEARLVTEPTAYPRPPSKGIRRIHWRSMCIGRGGRICKKYR